MNIELYIAKRILGNKSSHQTTKSITKIAQIGIAAGICVMLLSIFITSGFKNRIIENITQVSADITMQPAAYIGGWSNRGDSISATTLQTLKNAEEVETVYPTINKAVILKGSNELHGAILTGIDSTAPIELYQKSLIEGEIPNLHNNDASSLIAISQNIAKLLNVKVGDNVLAYFISGFSYFLAEYILFGSWSVLLISMSQSLIQSGGSAVFFVILGHVLDEAHIKTRFI